MRSLYKPGSSPIHLLPVRLKFVFFVLVSLAFALAPKSYLFSGYIFASVCALYLVGKQSIEEFARQAWAFRILLVLVAIPQLLINNLETATAFSLVTISTLMLAALFTRTTKTSELLGLVRNRSLALLVALSINSITLVTTNSQAIREASIARGVKPNLVKQIVNLFVVSLRQAESIGEALASRGVEV